MGIFRIIRKSESNVNPTWQNTMELNCKWHFGKEGGRDRGASLLSQEFGRNSYYSFVRESIQNSLDAVNDESKPVRVVFETIALNRDDYPGLLEIDNHILACREYFKKDEGVKRRLPDPKHLRLGRILKNLQVSDYNTKGMPYQEGSVSTPFYGFVRSEGVSNKRDGGAGGSFGFGKGAFFALSERKCLLVSTLDLDNNHVFEGVAVLTTHKSDSGETLSPDGFYDNNGGLPVTVNDEIPPRFIRDEPGTTIVVLDYIRETDVSEDEVAREIVKSVLRNFWLSVEVGKLQVDVKIGPEQYNLSEASLEKYLNKFFDKETSTTKRGESPVPFYQAYKEGTAANAVEKQCYFKKNIKILGDVEFYLKQGDGLPNKIAYMRRPRMLVYTKINNRFSGYAGVFVCSSSEGNAVLRDLENPSHDSWDVENAQASKHDKKRAKAALSELNSFIISCLDSIKVEAAETGEFPGLEEYLVTSESFTEINQMRKTGAQSEYPGTLFETSEQETGVSRSKLARPVEVIPNVYLPAVDRLIASGKKADSGSIVGTFGVTKGGKESRQPMPDPFGKQLLQVDLNDGPDTSVPIPGTLRIIGSTVNGVYSYKFIVSVSGDFERVNLLISLGADSGVTEEVHIIKTDAGTISPKNPRMITGVPVKDGRCVVTITLPEKFKCAAAIEIYGCK